MPESIPGGKKPLKEKSKKGNKDKQKKEDILEQKKSEEELLEEVEGINILQASNGILEKEIAAIDTNNSESIVRCPQCRKTAYHVRDNIYRCSRCGYFNQ